VARVVVLHNADFEPGGAVDETSVADAARAVAAALAARGHVATIAPVRGVDAAGALAGLAAAPPDLVFNLCESLAGDARHEPTLAGLLDLYGLRYTGNDALALASCLDKARCKQILVGGGVPTPDHRVFRHPRDLDDAALDALAYPWFVKPARADASVGITERNVVGDRAALAIRVGELLAELHQPVLGERYIAGREVNVGFVADRLLPLHEIDFALMPAGRPHIVSYAAKWDDHHVDYAGTKAVPLRGAAPALVERMAAVATAAYRALGLRDYGRVDLRVDAGGQPWVIDVNPNCDVSADAGLARAARGAGMDYADMIDAIVGAALARAA
jgi:D-alanine-D-alanine ligase